jgi:hypothetical protein
MWPAVGPGGVWAVVERNQRNDRDTLLYFDGKKVREIFHAQRIASPTFSGYGWMAFSASAGNKLDLYIWDPRGKTEPVKVTFDQLDAVYESQMYPAFGPGNTLYFTSGKRNWDIYSVQLPGYDKLAFNPLSAKKLTTIGTATNTSYFDGVLLFQKCSTFDDRDVELWPVCSMAPSIWAQDTDTEVTWQVANGGDPAWFHIPWQDFPDLVAIAATPTPTVTPTPTATAVPPTPVTTPTPTTTPLPPCSNCRSETGEVGFVEPPSSDAEVIAQSEGVTVYSEGLSSGCKIDPQEIRRYWIEGPAKASVCANRWKSLSGFCT